MNKTKRIVSTLVLLSMLCMLFAALPTAATTEADGNLLTNGALADADADGMPDGWSFHNTPSLMTPAIEGYAPPTGWTGNYVMIDKAKNTGIQQSVRQLEPGALYKASAAYTTTALSAIWEFQIKYYSGEADEKGTQFSKLAEPPVTLKFNKTVTAADWSPAGFELFPFGPGKETSAYVFKMPEIASGTLPEGASLGLLVRIRTSNDTQTVKLTDIRLEKTDNYVMDGSFEKGLGEWKSTTGGKAADAVVPTVESATDAPEGNMVVKMADSATKVYLSQKVFLESAKTYRVRFWFKGSSAFEPRLAIYDGSVFYAHYNAGGNVAGNNASTSAWRQYTYYFTPADTAYLQIRLATWSTTGETLYFDDIEISEVKENAETAFYSSTDGSEVTALPAAGTALLSRTIVKTTEPKDTAFVFFALYQHSGTAKKLVDVKIGGGEELAQITHHSKNPAPTNFIEIKDTYTMPATLDASAQYSLKVFVFEDLQNIKNLNKALTLQ